MKKILMLLSGCAAVILIIFVGLKIYGRLAPDKTTPELLPKEKFVKGEVIVTFKDEVGEREARALLEKYQLKETERFFKYNYVPLYSSDNNLEIYAEELKKMPYVKNAAVAGRDRSSVKPWIVVDFSKLISRDELGDLLKSFDKLYVKKDFYSLSLQTVQVPFGKEAYYVELLQREPIVKYALLNDIGHIN